MCFRPPTAMRPIKCPSCGAMNPPAKKNCVKCQADLTITQMNAVNWFEIPVSDLLRAKKFYESVFGYIMTITRMGEQNTAWFPMQAGSQGSSGCIVKRENYTPPADGAMVFLTVNNIDATLEKVAANGGKTVVPKTQMGDLGFYAHFLDSEGNKVGLYSQK